MTRIADLGKACDKAIKTLSKLMDGGLNQDQVEEGHLQLKAATEAIHTYFDYKSQGMSD